jgi:hypothetical protein
MRLRVGRGISSSTSMSAIAPRASAKRRICRRPGVEIFAACSESLIRGFQAPPGSRTIESL